MRRRGGERSSPRRGRGAPPEGEDRLIFLSWVSPSLQVRSLCRFRALPRLAVLFFFLLPRYAFYPPSRHSTLVGCIVQKFAAVVGKARCTTWSDACAGVWSSNVLDHRCFRVAFSPRPLSSSIVLVSSLVLLDTFRQVGCHCCVCGHVWRTATQRRYCMFFECVSFRSLLVCPPCAALCVSMFYLGHSLCALVVLCDCASCSGPFIAAVLCPLHLPCSQFISSRLSCVPFPSSSALPFRLLFGRSLWVVRLLAEVQLLCMLPLLVCVYVCPAGLVFVASVGSKVGLIEFHVSCMGSVSLRQWV